MFINKGEWKVPVLRLWVKRGIRLQEKPGIEVKPGRQITSPFLLQNIYTHVHKLLALLAMSSFTGEINRRVWFHDRVSASLFHCLEQPTISSPLRTPYGLQSPRTLASNMHTFVTPNPCKGETLNINIPIFENKGNCLKRSMTFTWWGSYSRPGFLTTLFLLVYISCCWKSLGLKKFFLN